MSRPFSAFNFREIQTFCAKGSLTDKVHSLSLGLVMVVATSLAQSTFAISASERQSTTASELRSSRLFPEMREVQQDGLKPHVDLTVGQALPEDRFRPGTELGLGFGFQPYIPFGLGLMIHHTVATPNTNGIRNIDRTAALVRGTYQLAGTTPLIRHSHFGVAAGPVINQDAMYFGLSPLVGFDIPVQEWIGEYYSYLTLGAEARYLFVSAPESDQFTLTAAAKFWF